MDGLLDVMHVTAQGVIAGANMILADFHPAPSKALVDSPQALLLPELPLFLEDIRIAHEAYLQRTALARQYLGVEHNAWDAAYESVEAVEWLLANRRGEG